MMAISRFRRVVLAALCSTVPVSCSYIKSYFPDKEKDYHYSREIPPLRLPPDLLPEQDEARLQSEFDSQPALATAVTNQSATGSESNPPSTEADDGAERISMTVEPDEADIVEIETQVISPAQAVSAQVTVDPLQMDQSEELLEQMTQPDIGGFEPVQEGIYPPGMEVETVVQGEAAGQDRQQAAPAEGRNDRSAVMVEETVLPAATDKIRFVVFEDGSKRIQLDEPLDKAWRRVGKALTHNSIEITGRHRSINEYDVQFDPNEQQYQDGSLWDEVVFFFGEDQKQEQAFRIKLLDGGSTVEVLVSDDSNKPLSDGDGLTLLQLLYRTMQADLMTPSR